MQRIVVVVVWMILGSLLAGCPPDVPVRGTIPVLAVPSWSYDEATSQLQLTLTPDYSEVQDQLDKVFNVSAEVVHAPSEPKLDGTYEQIFVQAAFSYRQTKLFDFRPRTISPPPDEVQTKKTLPHGKYYIRSKEVLGKLDTRNLSGALEPVPANPQ